MFRNHKLNLYNKVFANSTIRILYIYAFHIFNKRYFSLIVCTMRLLWSIVIMYLYIICNIMKISRKICNSNSNKVNDKNIVLFIYTMIQSYESDLNFFLTKGQWG